jgi:hypothetical protein
MGSHYCCHNLTVIKQTEIYLESKCRGPHVDRRWFIRLNGLQGDSVGVDEWERGYLNIPSGRERYI